MRHSWLLLALTLSLVALGGFATGCRCAGDHAALASLAERRGEVTRDSVANLKQWVGAPVGATFSLGEAVRTGPASTALLSLVDGSKLQVEPKTILRFSATPPKAGEHGFDVETGGALLEAGGAGLVLKTELGLARLEANTKVMLSRSERGYRFEVQVGRASLETQAGNKTLTERDVAVMTGQAIIEEPPAKLEPASAAAASAAPPEVSEVKGDISGQVVGRGVSLKRPGEDSFAALEPGAALLSVGSIVNVKRGSSLTLSHAGTRAELAGSGTYRLGGKGGTLVELEQGSIQLSGGTTRVMVPGGVIVTAAGAVATLDTVKDGTHISVQAKQVSIESAKGTEQVQAGQEAQLGRDGALKLEGRGLDYSDITLTVGESCVVHDPAPPTAVRFAFRNACQGPAVVRVKSSKGGQSASGEASVALPFAPGHHEYALYCTTGEGLAATAAATGTLTILQDAGTRPVPKNPPATAVEADGRSYTVMYQNQLPRVSLRWSTAPAAPSFSLSHRSPAGQRRYTLASAAYAFASGGLPEGAHVFYFEGGGKVSRQTTIRIVFDNKAPTASLQTPANLSVGQGDRVTIAGVAQPGWSVEINGKSADIDGQQRFSQQAEMPKGERALAVRLTHPRRGTHIYVRRAAGSP